MKMIRPRRAAAYLNHQLHPSRKQRGFALLLTAW